MTREKGRLMGTRFLAWAGLLALCGLASGFACARGVVVSNAHAAQYERVDLTFDLVAHWADPYDPDDVKVDVAMSTPGGGRLVVPAYLVSGASDHKSTWRASLSPRQVGTYRYQVEVLDGGKALEQHLAGTFDVAAGTGKGFLRVRDNWMLQFDNGELFRGVGENLAWEHRDHDDSKFFRTLNEDSRFNYDDMLGNLAANGGNFARVWMIYWNLPLDWQWVDNNARYRVSTSRFNESGIRRMDQLLALAEKNHVYLMLALDSHVGLMGEGWEHSVYNARNGGGAATPAEFFSSQAARKRYRDKLRYLVARWGYSTNIAAWEFFNEVDNAIYAHKEQPIPDELVTRWHREMSDYLKQLDPSGHIITTSISHREVAGLYDLPSIAINQRHIYKALNSIPTTLRQASAEHGKPFVIGEAADEWDWSQNFDDDSRGMIGHFKRQLWYGLFNPTPVLPMTWWWEYFDAKGMTPYFKGVQAINQRMLRDSEGRLQSVSVASSESRLTCFGVKAGKSTYVYLYNPTAVALTTRLELPGAAASAARRTAYDPEHQVNRDFAGGLDAVQLGPDQDLILILEPTH